MKKCTQCGASKPLSEYGKASTCVDGTRSYCKACHKLRKDAWRAKHKGHHNEKCRRWTAENPGKKRQATKKYSSKPETKKKQAEYKREYRKRNPEQSRAWVSSRRKKFRQATPAWVDKKAIRAIYAEAAARGLTVDHIVPLRHNFVSGLHVPWNLQLLPASENYSKSNSYEAFAACRVRPALTSSLLSLS